MYNYHETYIPEPKINEKSIRKLVHKALNLYQDEFGEPGKDVQVNMNTLILTIDGKKDYKMQDLV